MQKSKELNFDFRIDDIGASTKIFERYSKFPLGNLGFLKSRFLLGNWGPYQELKIEELEYLISAINQKKKKLAVAITAGWISNDNKLTPFNKRFPDQAKFLKEANDLGLVKILNHGLSHCVIGLHMPNPTSSNRIYHREFVDWLPEFIHKKHILLSQEILENWLGNPVSILAPPGNDYSFKTVRACEDTNIKYIHSSRNFVPENSSISFLDSRKCICFHDREVKLYGKKYIQKLLNN